MRILSFRNAEKADTGFLQTCARSAYEQYCEVIGREPAPMVMDFTERLQSSHVTIVSSGNEPVGYAVWTLSPPVLFLESIAVLKNFAAQGIGGRFMRWLDEQALARGASCVELYTNAKMTANIGLYQHLGFEITDRRMEDGFDRIYFRKDLSIEEKSPR